MALPESTLQALTVGAEGIEVNENGEFAGAKGRPAVDLYVLVSLVKWMELELRTGMKMTSRGSTLAKANEMLGTNYRRKQQAIDHIKGLLEVSQ